MIVYRLLRRAPQGAVRSARSPEEEEDSMTENRKPSGVNLTNEKEFEAELVLSKDSRMYSLCDRKSNAVLTIHRIDFLSEVWRGM